MKSTGAMKIAASLSKQSEGFFVGTSTNSKAVVSDEQKIKHREDPE